MFGRDTGGTVQRMKPATPPVAPSIRIGAELQQYIDHLDLIVPRHSNQRWRIEPKDRRVDARSQLLVLLEHCTQSARVAVANRALEALDRRPPSGCILL